MSVITERILGKLEKKDKQRKGFCSAKSSVQMVRLMSQSGISVTSILLFQFVQILDISCLNKGRE